MSRGKYKITEKHREKLSESHKGIKHTQETKEKLSKIMKERHKNGLAKTFKKGKDNPKWNGGYGERNVWWRKSIFEIDDYTCRKCGLKDTTIGFMEADHIKPKSIYPELKYDLLNGQTLCPNCHKKKWISENNKYGFLSRR